MRRGLNAAAERQSPAGGTKDSVFWTKTGRYDGDVADAVASFRAAYDLPAALYASPEMLSALDEAVTALNGQTYLVDDQLQSALEMCRLAAAKPQQYTVKSDGSWTKK